VQKNQKEISSEKYIDQGADRLLPYVRALSDIELARLIYLASTEKIIRDSKKELTKTNQDGV